MLRDIRTRVDLEKTGLTQEKIDLMTAQLKILIANLLKDGLDLFGGMPIYEMDDTEIKPRSTDVETFEYIERLIKENIDLIPAKETLGATETTYIHKAWAAVQLAQLYFNAEPYTKGKKSMFEECAMLVYTNENRRSRIQSMQEESQHLTEQEEGGRGKRRRCC